METLLDPHSVSHTHNLCPTPIKSQPVSHTHRAPRCAEGSGFRVQGSGFRVQGSGFRVQSSGFRVQGSGFRVQGSGFRVPGAGSEFRFGVQGTGRGVAGQTSDGPEERDWRKTVRYAVVTYDITCHVCEEK